MKFDLKIKISTEGLIKNYKKLDEINLFDDHYDNYQFYLSAVTLLEKNKLCNDIKRLHMGMVYLYLKIFEIINFMLFNIIYDNDTVKNVHLREEMYPNILKKTKIEVSDYQIIFHLKMAIEKKENDNCLPYEEKLKKLRSFKKLKEKGFMYMPIRSSIVESYMVEELVKRAIIAMCLDNSFVPSELREFLLYNITFELSECEEKTNEHEEEVNISQEKDNIDDQAEEKNDVDNQTANLELSQIDIDQVAKRTSLLIEVPDVKIGRILDWLIFCTEYGYIFRKRYRKVELGFKMNKIIVAREKIINAFFGLGPDDYSDEVWRKVKKDFTVSLLNLLSIDKRLDGYVVIAEGGIVREPRESEENE